MDRLIATEARFSFTARELSQQLLGHMQTSEAGYWEYHFDRLADREQPLHWHIGIANGQILYSGNQSWSVQSLIEVMARYVFQTRHALVKPRFDLLQRKAEEEIVTPSQFLAETIQARIADETQVRKALRTKILSDLDFYLLMGSGEAKFTADPDLVTQLPLAGFNCIDLLDESRSRQLAWEKLKPLIPSMSSVPSIDRAMMAKAKIPAGQQDRIEILVKSGKSLTGIADDMAKDPLEIADMFAKLVRVGIVKFLAPIQPIIPEPAAETKRLTTIMAIDDSPVMLTQFHKLVSALGYGVAVCQHAEQAIEMAITAQPAVIFIDLNMPGISGFELIKKIRQQPQLAKIPLAILTGEQGISNRWRAQWSGCEFICKPLTTAAAIDFQRQLAESIPRLIDATTVSADNCPVIT